MISVRDAGPQDLEQIARLMLEGFPVKLGRIFGSRTDAALSVLKEVLRIEHPDGATAFVAQEGSSVIGMLLLRLTSKPKIIDDWGAVWRIIHDHVGLLRLPRLLPALALLHYTVRPFEAYVEDVVVATKARGRGAGSRLLQHAEMWARDHGKRLLSLHVSLDNPRARALYERTGYAVRKVERSPLSSLLLGHRGFAYMTKVLVHPS